MTVAASSGPEELDARVVKALGHPTRVRILRAMRHRKLASPVELSHELDMPLGAVGYHVRRLEALGFIELARRTQRRGAIEHHYRVRDVLAGVDPGTSRTPDGSRGREATAIARLARAALARGGFDAVEAYAERRVLLLDARGGEQLGDALASWQETVERIGRASAARLARAGGAVAPHRCVAAIMRFDAPDGVPGEPR